jgi:type IV secretory pathway VirJ component
LSHFLQAYYHLPSYLTPFLIGYGDGASLAYATLVQAPGNTFAGALTVGFCPATKLKKPLCKGSGVEFTRLPGESGLTFLPAKKLENPWVALQGERDQVCGARAARDYIAKVSGAALVVLPRIGHDYAAAAEWLPQFLAAFDTLVERSSRSLAPPTPHRLGQSARGGNPGAARHGLHR